MKKESPKLSQTQSELLSQRESTTPHKAAKRDFIELVSEILLIRLESNTDDKSMSYEMGLKVDPGSINLSEFREILVLARIKEITIDNVTLKIIN
jgi:hypothetical protein